MYRRPRSFIGARIGTPSCYNIGLDPREGAEEDQAKMRKAGLIRNE